jgi:RNA polymerase sigma-70 factor (ECF subfamily)
MTGTVSHRLVGQEPFEQVVATHHPEIYRYVLRITARRSEADDLSQETFLRAYRAYSALPADANVRAWLFTIATNLCRNHFRSETRRRRAYAGTRATADGFAAAGPEGETLFTESVARVERAVERLPLRQRLAFVLRKIHELDYPAIAGTLGCSTDSARAHVFQAVKKIRLTLDGEDRSTRELHR